MKLSLESIVKGARLEKQCCTTLPSFSCYDLSCTSWGSSLLHHVSRMLLEGECRAVEGELQNSPEPSLLAGWLPEYKVCFNHRHMYAFPTILQISLPGPLFYEWVRYWNQQESCFHKVQKWNPCESQILPGKRSQGTTQYTRDGGWDYCSLNKLLGSQNSVSHALQCLFQEASFEYHAERTIIWLRCKVVLSLGTKYPKQHSCTTSASQVPLLW